MNRTALFTLFAAATLSASGNTFQGAFHKRGVTGARSFELGSSVESVESENTSRTRNLNGSTRVRWRNTTSTQSDSDAQTLSE